MAARIGSSSKQRRLVEESQRLCLALLRTDIDIAHVFLCVARTEFDMGAAPRAAELIEKAITARDSVAYYLEKAPWALSEQKRALLETVRELSDAIAAMGHELHVRPRVAR